MIKCRQSRRYAFKKNKPEERKRLMIKHAVLKLVGVVLFLLAISCATRVTPPAPIVNASQLPAEATQTAPAVAPTVTNTPPVVTKLNPIANDDQVQATPATQTKPVAPAASSTEKSATNGDNGNNWQKPTNGVLGAYTASTKGLDITGTEGQPIYAIAAGKVLYSGNGLKGYGNLVIIRHDSTYLSAYAYNKVNLVKEGTTVQQGQKIATMGVNNSQPMLHLEIRKNGKPIDPHTMIGN